MLLIYHILSFDCVTEPVSVVYRARLANSSRNRQVRVLRPSELNSTSKIMQMNMYKSCVRFFISNRGSVEGILFQIIE